MFDLKKEEDGRISLSGRFDAQQEQKARDFFDGVDGEVVVDFTGLDYISSAGLGVLVITFQRLAASGGTMKLTNLNPMVRNVFRYASLDKVFQIE